jgi:hypothetical protein
MYSVLPSVPVSQLRTDPSERKEEQRRRLTGTAADLSHPVPDNHDDSRSDHTFFFLYNSKCLWIHPLMY